MQIFLPIADVPVDLFVLLILGAAVGFLSGVFGIGGRSTTTRSNQYVPGRSGEGVDINGKKILETNHEDSTRMQSIIVRVPCWDK